MPSPARKSRWVIPADPRTNNIVTTQVPSAARFRTPRDAGSGSLLYHFGLTEFAYYTVLFAVSRSLGISAQAILNNRDQQLHPEEVLLKVVRPQHRPRARRRSNPTRVDLIAWCRDRQLMKGLEAASITSSDTAMTWSP
jgi:hypothetical protein